MFFQGMMVGSSTVSLANFQADIIGLLTGSITSPAQLSSNFLPGSILNNTVAPGWELADNAAGAAANGVTPKVIRAPYSDDPTKFKNVFINSPVASQLGFNGYEEWNPATHIGVNPMQIVLAGSSFQSIPSSISTAPAMFTISSTANHIYLCLGESVTHVVKNCIYFSEYSRDDPWNTVANGYPSWLQSGHATYQSPAYPYPMELTSYTAIPRAYDSAINTDRTSIRISGTYVNTGSTPRTILCPNGQLSTPYAHYTGGGSLAGGSSCLILAENYLGADVNKVGTKYLLDVALRMANGNAVIPFIGAFLGGNCSAIAPHVFYTANNAVPGDTIVMNNKKYQISGISNARLAILME